VLAGINDNDGPWTCLVRDANGGNKRRRDSSKTKGKRHCSSKERDGAVRGIQGTEHASRWEVKRETKTL
jgi:hypothetical protein